MRNLTNVNLNTFLLFYYAAILEAVMFFRKVLIFLQREKKKKAIYPVMEKNKRIYTGHKQQAQCFKDLIKQKHISPALRE